MWGDWIVASRILPAEEAREDGGDAGQAAAAAAGPEGGAAAAAETADSSTMGASSAAAASGDGAAPAAGAAIVELAPKDLDQLREDARRRYKAGELHGLARADLNRICEAGVPGASTPGGIRVKFPWRAYVATHPQSEELVGLGVVLFAASFVEGTKDCNRGGQPRCDFEIRREDGSYWRIHPGRKPKDDAQPVLIPAEHASELAAATQWQLGDGGFTMALVRLVPPGDRIGKKEAWATLQDLPLGDLDNSETAFRWWLWLANLDQQTELAVGTGARQARLTRKGWDVNLRITRNDMTEADVCLRRRSSAKGRLDVKVTLV